jgi:hypothetical protein
VAVQEPDSHTMLVVLNNRHPDNRVVQAVALVLAIQVPVLLVALESQA